MTWLRAWGAALFVYALAGILPAAIVSDVKLDANRIPAFAAAPWLDATVSFDLSDEAIVRTDFWVAKDGMPVEESRRTVEMEFGAGNHTIRLSNEEAWIWLINLEPIEKYRLYANLNVDAEDYEVGPKEIDPVSLGEEGALDKLDLSSGNQLLRRRVVVENEGNSEGPIELYRHTVGVEPSGTRILVEEGPPPGEAREYQLFTPFSVTSPEWEYGTTGKAFKLAEDGWSVAAVEDLVWMKSLEWRFSTSPVATGWETYSDSPDIITYYSTDFTKTLNDRIDIEDPAPGIPHRIHRLRVENTGDKSGIAGWRLDNLFRDPESDKERSEPGKNHPGKARDLTNRLLRIDAVFSGDGNPGEDYFPALIVEADGMEFIERPFHYTAMTDEFYRLSAFVAPPHNMTDSDDALNFRFEVEFNDGSEGVQVNLENLRIWETIIADLPSGDGYTESIRDPWPMISMLRPRPDYQEIIIEPTADQCGASPAWDQYYLADHTMFLDEKDRWNLYGIFNSKKPFTPLDEGGQPLSNSPFFSGLVHALSCNPGATIDAATTSTLGRADFKGAVFDVQRRTPGVFVDKDQPLYFFGPWAPDVVELGKTFVMFYTEHNQFHPRKLQGFGYATTETPSDPASWKQWRPESKDHRLVYTAGEDARVRDLALTRRTEGSRDLYHAVWIGKKAELPGDEDAHAAKVLHKKVYDDPRLLYTVPAEEEYVIYDEANPDSGRIDSDSESPMLIYDGATEIFYLLVTKNATLYPGSPFRDDLLVLDQERGVLAIADLASGDRSDLVSDGLYSPVAFTSLQRFFWEPMWEFGTSTFNYQYDVAVVDGANKEYGIPAALLLVDCLSGEVRTMDGSPRSESPLESPTDITRFLFDDENGATSVGLVVSDAGNGGPSGGRLYGAVLPLSGERSEQQKIIAEGLSNPRALFADSKGVESDIAEFGSEEEGDAFVIRCRVPGEKPTAAGGDYIIWLQHPMRADEPLTVSLSVEYPDENVCITLETDSEGNPVTTVAELAEAVAAHDVVSDLLVAQYDEAFAEGVVGLGRKRMSGGLDRRTLFLATDEGIMATNLTDFLEAGKPWLVADAAFEWDPVGLFHHDEELYILDKVSETLYRVGISSGPVEVHQSDALITGIVDPIGMSYFGDRIHEEVTVYQPDKVSRFDWKSGSLELLLSPDQGHGVSLGAPVGAFATTFILEGIDAGTKVYWSRLDEETGRLLPFTSDHYIGHLPYHAVELEYDENQPESLRRWFLSAPGPNRSGGYEVKAVQWLPGLGPPQEREEMGIIR